MNLKINVSEEIMVFLLKEKHLTKLCVRSSQKHLANTNQQQCRTGLNKRHQETEAEFFTCVSAALTIVCHGISTKQSVKTLN